MSKFQCILCLKSSKNLKPIPLTKKVNDNITLEDCIKINLPCANLILHDHDTNQFSCTNCFTEFVNFYEFIKIVEDNYSYSSEIIIKSEPEINENDNFIDMSQITHYDPYREAPVILKDCSVVLDRCLLTPGKIKVESIDADEVKNEKEEVKKENPKAKDTRNDDDSDFEWPANDDFWEQPAEAEGVQQETKKPARKPIRKLLNEQIDPNYDPKLNNTGESVLYTRSERSKRGQRNTYERYLPSDLMTPKILEHTDDYITIDGIKYRIPRNRVIEEKPQIHPQMSRRRPHRAYDFEGEKKIADSVEVKCHVCGVELENFMRVRKHFKKFHPEQKGYLHCWCGIPKKFTRRYDLLDHLDYHENSQTFKCVLCIKEYKTAKLLKIHIDRIHLKLPSSTNATECICETCGKVCISVNSLKSHSEVHNVGDFECYICHIPKGNFKSLKAHMWTMHYRKKQDRSLVCSICSKMVKESYWSSHMKKNHSLVKKKRVKCPECDFWLLECSMPAHMKKHKSENEGAHCPICKKFLFNKGSLNKHVRTHNKDLWKFVCTYEGCDKRFYVPVKLKEHIAVHHTGEYPWSCRVCERPFRAEANWRQHEKKQHPEEYEKRLKPAYLRSDDDPMLSEGVVVETLDVVDF